VSEKPKVCYVCQKEQTHGNVLQPANKWVCNQCFRDMVCP
jgi:hypothetical protein